ncbi:MAG: 50S ribosomal protein L4 [Candidatus Microgenomates bacterium]
MKINVYSISGQPQGSWELDLKILGKLNPTLLAQALRVYESNSHQGTSSTKTRGEVSGSTKKIYRQKGTGNARHGAKYAPIFVGGGIAHGPKSIRPDNLKLSKAMRRRSLASAILTKLNEKSVSGLTDLKKASGKTSAAATLLATVAGHPKNKVLVITKYAQPLLFRMVRSLQGVTIKRSSLINAYDLIANDHIVTTKSAYDALVARTIKPISKEVSND